MQIKILNKCLVWCTGVRYIAKYLIESYHNLIAKAEQGGLAWAIFRL